MTAEVRYWMLGASWVLVVISITLIGLHGEPEGLTSLVFFAIGGAVFLEVEYNAILYLIESFTGSHL